MYFIILNGEAIASTNDAAVAMQKFADTFHDKPKKFKHLECVQQVFREVEGQKYYFNQTILSVAGSAQK